MGVELASGKYGFHETEDATYSDSLLVCHVRDILNGAISGDSDGYNQLVGHFHHKRSLYPDEVSLLVTSLKALSRAVSCVDIAYHKSLLDSIFAMRMWNYEPDVMDALLEVIVSLAATNGKYLDLCLEMLVNNFKPPFSFLELLDVPRGLAKKDQVLSRVHSAFKDIADLVPLSPLRLLEIVVGNRPNLYSKDREAMIYMENMFKLESGTIGELVGSTILMAVVDVLIELDVEIGWDDILQDDTGKGMFEMELEDMDDIEDDEQFSGDSLSWKSLSGNIIAQKLDSLMVQTFAHLESCAASGRLNVVFETLLQSFQITILNTYKSKFAQFVMFYACALDPENCGGKFAFLLADTFVCNVHPPLTRMSAVAYLASYLARAKFLSTSLVTTVLQRLVDWCVEYCRAHGGGGDIDPKAHRLFYSGCQAIMYVLCFRMRSIMSVPRFKTQLLLMPIDQILKHKLDPLKVCLPSVVQEFLQQAKSAHLFTVLEKFIFNDLLESELSKSFGGLERLDMFFPFDPCLLKKSDRYIRKNFIYWSMVKSNYDGEHNNDGEGSSDEDVEELDSEIIIEEVMSMSFNEQGLDLALNQMSISPKITVSSRFGGRTSKMPSKLRPSMSPESL